MDPFDFLDCVRNADWNSVSAAVEQGDSRVRLPCPADTVAHWLVELDAPSALVVALSLRAAQTEAFHPGGEGVLERCLEFGPFRQHATSTFASLLDAFPSPDQIVTGGMTLFQKVLELNRVDEMRELLRHGVDPEQLSVFGSESTSNLHEAREASNAAARLALDAWSGR